jgi:hypothetical protein
MPGGIRAIQLGDTTSDGELGTKEIGTYHFNEVADRYWARPGDLVFRSRGEKNLAVLLDERLMAPAVAVMPLVILRPKKSMVVAEYLAWFINQPEAQHYFDLCARGTGMRMIPMSSLSSLEIPLPSLDRQTAIAETSSLARLESRLASKLVERRQQLRSLSLLECAHSNDTTEFETSHGGRA